MSTSVNSPWEEFFKKEIEHNLLYDGEKMKEGREKDLLQLGGQASERFYLSRANSAS